MVFTNAGRPPLFCLALTVAILAVGKAGPASADYFASPGAIEELTRSVRAGGCSTTCKLADGTQATIAGSDVEVGIFYELTHRRNCGSSGCGKTAVLIEKDVVRLVGNGYGLDTPSVLRLALIDPQARARMPILSASKQAERQNKEVKSALLSSSLTPEGWNDGKRAIARDLLADFDNDLSRIHKVADAARYGLIAGAAYREPDKLGAAEADGFEQTLKLDKDRLLVGDATATLFIHSSGEVVLAFRGTSQGRDWVTNIGGTLSWTPLLNGQVADALRIAEDVYKEHPEVVFVGHSLGGRLAQVASMKTGQPAFVFNSAPVGLNEIRQMGFLGLLGGDIHRFRSPQDPLSRLFPLADQEVSNIPEVTFHRNWAQLGAKSFTHAMGILAVGMEDVRLARDEGWIAAYLREQQEPSVEPPAEEAVSRFMFNYPMYELNKLKVVGKDCFIFAPWQEPTKVQWSGACEKSKPVGDGRILWLKNDRVTRIDNVGDDHGMVFRDGKLHIYKDLSEISISFICRGNRRYGEVRLPGETNESLFHNNWLASSLARRSIEAVAEECPPSESGFSRQNKYQDVKITIYILPSYLNGQEMLFASSKPEAEFKWRHYKNYTQKAIEEEIKNENTLIRKEQRRIKKQRQQEVYEEKRQAKARRQEEARRIEAERAAAIKRQFDKGRERIIAKAKSFMESGSGSLDDLAAALEWDEVATLERLENGISLGVGPVDGVETVDLVGQRAYRSRYSVGSPFSRYETKFRASQKFSWNNWFALTQSGPRRRTDVNCTFKKLGDIPKQPKTIKGSLLSFSSNSQLVSISLLCR